VGGWAWAHVRCLVRVLERGDAECVPHSNQVCWALCIPVSLLWYTKIEALMVALGQCPTLAAHASGYLRALVPSLFVYVLAECLQVC
jgi:hypothetical protein